MDARHPIRFEPFCLSELERVVATTTTTTIDDDDDDAW